MPKHRIQSESLKVKAYPVLVHAVEAGVAYGYHRAFKHTEKPTEAQIIEQVADAVITEICEAFDFSFEETP